MSSGGEINIHRANRLLATMGPREFSELLPDLEVVPLDNGQVLVDAGERITHAYFPHAGVIGLMAVMPRGGMVETATVGPEGFVFAEPMLDGDRAANRATVQVAGVASRIELRRLRAATEASPALRRLLLRAVHSLLVQALQSAACSSLHPVDERCARWLLTAHDCAASDTFRITQNALAEMLGVHRPSLTVAAQTLQSSGLISYSRGVVTITDRAGLERAACECYGVVRRAMSEMLPPPRASRRRY